MYLSYTENGYNFSRSIYNPDSQFRRVYDHLVKYDTITRLEYYVLHNRNGIENYGKLGRVRPGWGTTFWRAIKRAGLVKEVGRTSNGYIIWGKGDNFRVWGRSMYWADYDRFLGA